MLKTKVGKFYLLPKLHKVPENILIAMENDENARQGNLVPGRPIVSLCGTPLHNIGNYIDYFLVPLVQKQNTYIKDTTSFINMIENTKTPDNCYLTGTLTQKICILALNLTKFYKQLSGH